MEVALLVCNDTGSRVASPGIIEECSPQGVWYGLLVPQIFFVTDIVIRMNLEFREHIAYCEEATVNTLGATTNHRILWSGYKVRPTKPLYPPSDHIVKKEDISRPPIGLRPKVDDKAFIY